MRRAFQVVAIVWLGIVSGLALNACSGKDGAEDGVAAESGKGKAAKGKKKKKAAPAAPAELPELPESSPEGDLTEPFAADPAFDAGDGFAAVPTDETYVEEGETDASVTAALQQAFAMPAAAPQAAAQPGSGGGAFLWVFVDVLNVRAEPSVHAAKVAQLGWGKKVANLGSKNGWVKIGEGQYVARRYLTDRKARWTPKAAPAPVPEAAPAAAPATPLLSKGKAGTPASWRVDASALNVRAAPRLDAGVVGKLARGSVVSGKTAAGGWIEIQPGQYVAAQYLKPAGGLAH